MTPDETRPRGESGASKSTPAQDASLEQILTEATLTLAAHIKTDLKFRDLLVRIHGDNDHPGLPWWDITHELNERPRAYFDPETVDAAMLFVRVVVDDVVKSVADVCYCDRCDPDEPIEGDA